MSYKIGVISDTHVPMTAGILPPQLICGLEDVDLIIHAGDFVEMSVLEELRAVADVCAVHGNSDEVEVRKALPASRTLTVAGKRIGIWHGKGGVEGLSDLAQQTLQAEHGGTFDIIVFGHSHLATEDWKNNTLRFNPGSPTNARFTGIPTFGILTLGETVKSEIIPVS